MAQVDTRWLQVALLLAILSLQEQFTMTTRAGMWLLMLLAFLLWAYDGVPGSVSGALER